MVTGIELITAERRRQVDQKGYSDEHDEIHSDGSLALIAALYATPHPLYVVDVDDDRKLPVSSVRGLAIEIMDPWPSDWIERHDKRGKLSRIRQLEIAGALIAAELDRLLRADEPGEQRCRVCGCTDSDCSGCIERTGSPCYWVEDDLCSACAEDAV